VTTAIGLSRDELALIAEAEFDEDAQDALLGFIVNSASYASDPTFFNDLAARLLAASGITARKLVGALEHLESIETTTAEVRGDEDAVHVKLNAEREAWVQYAVGALYRKGTLDDKIGALPGLPAVPSGGAFVGKRVDKVRPDRVEPVETGVRL
jgi:hypothetical protein